MKYFIIWHDLDGVHVKDYKTSEELMGQYTDVLEKGGLVDLLVKGDIVQVKTIEKRPAYEVIEKELPKDLPPLADKPITE
jgi:hypothetical protein